MTRKPFARQLQRVRKICLSLPDATEKLSHGEPTFFVKKRVFAMFSNNHHSDGHVAVDQDHSRQGVVRLLPNLRSRSARL